MDTGVSARFSIAGAETLAASALHRATTTGEPEAVARVVDLDGVIEVLGGKVEFETGEEGREQQILTHLLRTAIAETARSVFVGIDLAPLVHAFGEGAVVTTGAGVRADDLLASLPALPGSSLYDEIAHRLGATDAGARASAIELALEGLYLARKVSKDTTAERTIYG